MFRPEKAAAMTSFFLERAGGRLNDLKLMKLLYMSERRSLHRYNASITDSAFYSMRFGPVLADAYTLFRSPDESEIWGAHIGYLSQKEGQALENTVVLKAPLEAEAHLSRAEVAILEEVWTDYNEKGKWEIVDITHLFPEWHKAAGMPNMKRIRLNEQRIFQEGFKDPPEVAARRAADIEYYRELMG